jgi:Uma2 family endonuclease
MALEPQRHRFTVAEYERMGAAGIFGEDDRVELIAGEIIEMSPIGRRHVVAVDRLANRFGRRLGARVIVRVQSPVRLGEQDEPQPDVVLLRARDDFYASSDPTSADLLLVVEVAETSLRYDRRVKIPLYARHGVAEAWLLDVTRRTLTVFRDPAPTGYRTGRVPRPGDRLAPLAFPDVAFDPSEIVG